MSTSEQSGAKKKAASRSKSAAAKVNVAEGPNKAASALTKGIKGSPHNISGEKAVELAKRAGILTAAGKLAPFYR